MNPLVAQIVGVIVRAVLVIIGTSLTDRGALAPDQLEQLLSTETQTKVVGWLMVAAPVVWSIWQKKSSLKDVLAALHLRPGSTMSEIKERASDPDIAAFDMKHA